MKKSILPRLFSLLLTFSVLSTVAIASHHEDETVSENPEQEQVIQDENWADSPNPQNLDEKKISRYAIDKQIVHGDSANEPKSINGFLWVIGILMILVLGGLGAIMADLRKVSGAEDKTDYNKLNAKLMLGFLVVMFVGVAYNVGVHGKYVKLDSSAEHGQEIDKMLIITIILTGIVFVITQALLFWFAYRYQYKKDRKALYYPENDKLEIAWTVAPAVVLTVLVLFGFRAWNNTMVNHEMKGHDYTTEAYPYQVELFAYQFGWKFRYPGADGILGDYDFRNIDYGEKGLDYTNPLGIDVNDPNGRDDVVLPFLKLPKGKTVRLVMRSSDVLHAMLLPDFSAQIYCIPNTQTEFHIKPLYTTAEKRDRDNNPDFEYELACNQICGRNHYSMRQAVEVMTEDDFGKWMAEQVPALPQAAVESKQVTQLITE